MRLLQAGRQAAICKFLAGRADTGGAQAPPLQAGRQCGTRLNTQLSSAQEHVGVCHGRARGGSSSCRQGGQVLSSPQHILLLGRGSHLRVFKLPQSCLVDVAALCKGTRVSPCSDLQALLWHA